MNIAMMLLPILPAIPILFFKVLPDRKKKKEAIEMRKALVVGDKVVTAGGVVGKIVQITTDFLTLETGENNIRLELTRTSVSAKV